MSLYLKCTLNIASLMMRFAKSQLYEIYELPLSIDNDDMFLGIFFVNENYERCDLKLYGTRVS